MLCMFISFLSIFARSLKLERMMNAFWWGSKRYGSGGITWMKWGRLCKPKAYGGIGFKNFHKFNVAMLGRQG